MEKMLQAMMKRFPWFIGMGIMIVMIAVIIGAVNAANTTAYYAVDKITRDSSLQLAQVRAGIESTLVWLPYFKFLGVAMILGGITMALGVIALRLPAPAQPWPWPTSPDTPSRSGYPSSNSWVWA
jgi:hypothetical protein